ncbi:hypothetical protein S40293_08812 [Stachybotrys chartarum IBT 40293]|nr:hypothetical protein S40293_08812 [Stachybotrys chartarum IBT 40293]
MTPSESWCEGDGMQPGPSSHQDQLNRQMIRHLMTQYSHEDIMRIFQEESRTSSQQNDAASVFTSSTHSSVKSEDAISVFDSGSSIRTFSDTSSTRGSIISNVSARTSKFLNRRSHASTVSNQSQTDVSTMDAEDAAGAGDASSGSANASKQKGAFMCGFCKEEGIQKTCTRKNDLKRHIEDFHNMNAQWFCRHRGCQMVFDWQTAYKTHLKVAHGGSRMSLDDGKLALCPQTVFACGFETCSQVFEASTDDDAGTVFKEYVGHVVKHFDEGANSGEWTYSTRIRNLLRQAGVMRAWNNSSWPEAERNRLKWSPQTSGILRKRLETRHIGDLQLLIQYAILTGTDPSGVHKFTEDFITPVREECQMSIPGHKIRAQIMPSNPPPMESETPEFRISRGANPSLAAYLATQRRVYVPRPPVRSGRSARAPVRAPTTPMAPVAPQYAYHNGSAQMYDPRQQQQQHRQHYAIMPHTNGVIAEDISSLRSMTGHTPDPDAMDMGDTQMVDTSYMAQHQQHGFSGQYATGDMQTSGSLDACGMQNTAGAMDQHQATYMAYNSGHPY